MNRKKSTANKPYSLDKINKKLSLNNKDNNNIKKEKIFEDEKRANDNENIYNKVKSAFSPKKESTCEKFNYEFSTNELISKYKYFRQFHLNSPKTMTKIKNFNLRIKNPFFPNSINSLISYQNNVNIINYNFSPVNNKAINYYNKTNLINSDKINKNITNNNKKNTRQKKNSNNPIKNDYFVSPLSPKMLKQRQKKRNEFLKEMEKEKRNDENQNNDNDKFLTININNKEIDKDIMHSSKSNEFLGKKRYKDAQRDKRNKSNEKKEKKDKKRFVLSIDLESKNSSLSGNENKYMNEDDKNNLKEKSVEKKGEKKNKRKIKSSTKLSKEKYLQKRKKLDDEFKSPIKSARKKYEKKKEKKQYFTTETINVSDNKRKEPEITEENNIINANSKNEDRKPEPTEMEYNANNNSLQKENEVDNDLNKAMNNSFSIFNEENIRYNNEIMLGNPFGKIEDNIKDKNKMQIEEKEKVSKNEEKNLEDINEIINQYKDRKFRVFERDLKDFFLRITSEEREEKLFEKMLPESIEIVKKLVEKEATEVPLGIVVPVYRNKNIEITLTIEKGGLMRKKTSLIKP